MNKTIKSKDGKSIIFISKKTKKPIIFGFKGDGKSGVV